MIGNQTASSKKTLYLYVSLLCFKLAERQDDFISYN
jgi:hypothetical protein